MGSFSLIHWLVVFGIALLLFGNRLPGIGKSLGEGIRNFKSGLNGDEDENGSNTANSNTNNQSKPHSGDTKQITASQSESAQQNENSKNHNHS